MKEFTVYFEIYGKKMKTTITAESAIDARTAIRNSIIFHKVEAESDTVLQDLKDIFKMK